MKTVLLVTGGRTYDRADHMVRAFHAVRQAYPGPLVVLHGACGLRGRIDLPRVAELATGADGMAHRWATWAQALGEQVDVVPRPADWRIYGKFAGPRRNTEMVLLACTLVSPRAPGHAPSGKVLVLAFPGGAGTADCVRQARSRELPVATVGFDGALRWDS